MSFCWMPYCWMSLLHIILLNDILLNVIVLNTILMNVILLNLILLNVIVLNAIMLNVILFNVTIECHSAECLSAECLSAECHSAECHTSECHSSECCGANNYAKSCKFLWFNQNFGAKPFCRYQLSQFWSNVVSWFWAIGWCVFPRQLFTALTDTCGWGWEPSRFSTLNGSLPLGSNTKLGCQWLH